MDGAVLAALIGLASVAITAIYAPKLDAKRKERAAAKDKLSLDRSSELDTIREEQRELRSFLKDEVNELRNENVRKDARIEVLEARVTELQNNLEMFRLGLTHPPGFILVPTNVWTSLRSRLGDQLPPGPFVGEDVAPGRREQQ